MSETEPIVPKMDPGTLMDLAKISGSLMAVLGALQGLPTTEPGTRAVLCSQLDKSIESLRALRRDCKVLL